MRGAIHATAVCNVPSPKWLLMAHDHSEEDDLPVLQALMRYRLGVAVVAGIQAGIIRCNRGGITVLNRSSLETASCDCVVTPSVDRLMRALKSAIRRRQPPKGCIHRSDPLTCSQFMFCSSRSAMLGEALPRSVFSQLRHKGVNQLGELTRVFSRGARRLQHFPRSFAWRWQLWQYVLSIKFNHSRLVVLSGVYIHHADATVEELAGSVNVHLRIQYGDADRLKWDDVAPLEPGGDEVVIRNHTVGLNHCDIDLRRGLFGVPRRFRM